MIESILSVFTSDQKAEIILSNPLIEFIFMILLITFILAVFVHLTLFNKLKKIRNYVADTNRMDIDPLHSFKEQFNAIQQSDGVKAETFVQERFSGWRLFSVPVVSIIKMIQMTVSVFILLGVLGTFIGLTISLGSIDAEGSQLVENVVGVLAGIDMAFYTSIAGMGLSLIMTVLIKVLNTEYMLTDIMLKVESNLEGDGESGINRLIDVSETINQSILGLQETNQQSLSGIEKAFTGFQEYTTGLQKSAEDLALFNDGLSDNLVEFQALFQSMSDVTAGFGESTTKLNTNFDSLFSYFKKSDGRNERLIKMFDNTSEKIKEVAKTQINTLNKFDESVVELKDFTSSLLEEQNTIQSSFDDLVNKMERHNQAFKKVFGDDLTSQLSGMMSHLGKLSRDFETLGTSVVKLPEALDVINRTQSEYKHLLSDRFEELKEFNRSFSDHLKVHASDSMAFEKQMNVAVKTNEQIAMKNSQFINEMNATISQMNTVFSQRETQMEASVDILKDTLTNYVAGLEGSLGNKLDDVMRSIVDSVGRTQAGIKSEFMELRRLSEEVQQTNSQYTQSILQELHQEIQTLNRLLNTSGQQMIRVNRQVGQNQNEY